MSKTSDYVIGVDFGTSSVRSILVDAHSGEEFASSEFVYPRWNKGFYCDASKNQFRQHPLDHLEGLEYTIKGIVDQVSQDVRQNIRAISMDTTGSTPVAVDDQGTPLALHPDFEDNPNAMFFLWKDHSAVSEAEEINKHAGNYEKDYLKYSGGIYSSEWYWAKLLFVLREDSEIRDACFSWVEHCDWLPYLLTGQKDISKMKRSVCAAGHKALWAKEFGGFPPDEFFADLDPLLKGFRNKLPDRMYSSEDSAGKLSQEWADKFGLSVDVSVGIGALDAHMGAVGGQIKPFYLSKVMGTSTCDMIVAPKAEVDGMLVKGICGQVDGSIIPGMLGMEAGQSAFGDIYEWFKEVISWPINSLLLESRIIDKETALKLQLELKEQILHKLSKEASELPLQESDELAVDWLNGRRTPDANQLLKGAIFNLTLGSTAAKVFRSLVEATCFGSRRIIERFIEEGIPVKGLIAVGGVAKKSAYIMQMMADVTGMKIMVHKSEQTCALGASMFAATVAGIYPRVEDAMEKMGQGFHDEFIPHKEKNDIYNNRYQKYLSLCQFIESIYYLEKDELLSSSDC